MHIFDLKFIKSTAVLLLLALLAACAGPRSSPKSIPEPVSQPEIKSEQDITEPETPDQGQQIQRRDIHLMAVGDIMLGTDYPKNRLPLADGQNLLADVMEILASADITFGNYEGVLLDNGKPAKRCKNPSRCYVFRTPAHYAENLLKAGFDVLSLANNHSHDFGESGRDAMLRTLDEYGIRHAGPIGDIAQWRVKESQVALIAFAPFRGSYDPNNLPAARKLVADLAEHNDIVIVSMHMGAEGREALRIPFAMEYFHGEQRGDVVQFSRAMIDAGADLILGHGPHVPRALEVYQERLIAYSLGNFCTYLGFNVRGTNGLSPILSVLLDAQGRFKNGRIISARQQRPWGPLLDDKHTAAQLIADLTVADFPDTPIEILSDGTIQYKSEAKQ